MNLALKEENIASQIFFIRGEKVLLDIHLAVLYDVETRALKQQVKRNIERFPSDFMFELTENEVDYLVSQNVIAGKSRLGELYHMFLLNKGWQCFREYLIAQGLLK